MDVQLREVRESDLPVFFEHHRDPEATQMAAFTVVRDNAASLAHWRRILDDPTTTIRTVTVGGEIAGSVSCYVDEEFAGPEVTYWIGREFWGRGIATAALREFLRYVTTRPLYARAAKDNTGSLRVLDRCGFVITGEDQGHSDIRGCEVEELILELTT
ncbi:GNAT family N-acetyltransferase [Actinopolymorpha alba]|uniref:GNAT family N-acetyltransferase n=1 Tax=Actinopolymorpha alba TaxID=533267 RepID=UPI000381B8FD|nr:GNAT family N-acetyltransferase [Actinopolymorpha alba]